MQEFLFNKVAGLMTEACNFLKKETLAQVFSYEFCKISKNTLFTEHLWVTASAMEPYFQSEPFRSSQRRCSVKKLFSNVLQHSQGNICV